MKSILLSTCLFFGATTAMAGNYETPYMDPPVIVEDAADSSANSAALVLGLMTLIVFGVAASAN